MAIIIKKDYYNYIDNNKLKKDEKENIKNCFKIKSLIYDKIEKSHEIYFSYKYNNKYFRKVFLHFINENKLDEISKLLEKEKQSDYDVIKNIKNEDLSYSNKVSWKYPIKFLTNNYIHNIDKNIKKIKYLDIGCGNGNKTLLFAKYLEEYKINVDINGTDIKSWGPYHQNRKLNFNFKYIDNNKLPYKNEEFDFITIILALHHIEKLDVFLLEVKRIIKKNGILLIVEHDSYTDKEKIILSIQHKIYSGLSDRNYEQIKNPLYIETYNRYEWNYILSKYDFKLIKQDYLYFTEKEPKIRYDKIYYNLVYT